MPVSLFIKQLDELLAENGLSFVSTLIDILITFALARLIVAIVGRTARSIVTRRAKEVEELRARRLTTAVTLITSIVKYVAYFIAIAIAVGELGYAGAMNSMLAAAGIGSLAIGIGAQNVIRDVTAGVIMLFEDQLAVGDYVTVAGITGTVEAVTLRTTTVRSYGGELSVIPNGSISVLTNYSRTDSLAIVEVPVAYEADAERALALMREEAEAYHAELGDVAVEQPEVVGAVQLTGGEMVLRVVQRVKPLAHWEVQRELTRRIAARFVREGIALPRARVQVAGKEGEEA
ncbi:MAG: mechanosensitive ion channel family protein [Christensenellales bacterium]